MFLIDDSVENALACANADPPVPVLLFGDYEWNKRESLTDEPKDNLGYEERLKYENGKEWWKEEYVKLPENIRRVKDWPQVVQWVKDNCKP